MIIDSWGDDKESDGGVGLYGVSSATNLCGIGNQTGTTGSNTENRGEN